MFVSINCNLEAGGRYLACQSTELTIGHLVGKGKVCIRAKWHIRAGIKSCFCSMKRLGILLLPPGWDAILVHCKVTRQLYDCRYPGTHLYTWVKRHNVK